MLLLLLHFLLILVAPAVALRECEGVNEMVMVIPHLIPRLMGKGKKYNDGSGDALCRDEDEGEK